MSWEFESARHFYGFDQWSSGRIVLPADASARHHIAEGDTVVLINDGQALHVKTHEQALAEAQAYFVNLAPANVMLSKEILADRRAESERD